MSRLKGHKWISQWVWSVAQAINIHLQDFRNLEAFYLWTFVPTVSIRYWHTCVTKEEWETLLGMDFWAVGFEKENEHWRIALLLLLPYWRFWILYCLRVIKLNLLPTYCKQYDVLVFLIVNEKSVEVPIELSEDCYCDLSVPIAVTLRFTYSINCQKRQNDWQS